MAKNRLQYLGPSITKTEVVNTLFVANLYLVQVSDFDKSAPKLQKACNLAVLLRCNY